MNTIGGGGVITKPKTSGASGRKAQAERKLHVQDRKTQVQAEVKTQREQASTGKERKEYLGGVSENSVSGRNHERDARNGCAI